MQINYKHITLSLTVCAALAACTDEASSIFSPDNGKTPIELSIGGVDAPDMTRAVITDGTSHDMRNFDKAANIFMVMKSEYGTADFEGEQTDKYTVSRGRVAEGQNTINFDTNNQKYWDDAHARSSQLSIWAYASKCPENWYECNFQTPKADWAPQEHETPEHLMQEYEDHKYVTSSSIDWSLQSDKGSKGAIYPCIMLWRASHNITGDPLYRQDANSILCQDLLFSNNLAYNGADKDGRLKFNFGTRKFPTGDASKMNFYHAMSKITIHIKKGDGFNSFNFSSGNITLKKFNTEGTFNIKDGQFQQIKATYDIPQIYKHTPADPGDDYTLEALVVPNIHEFLSSHSSSDSNSRFVKDANTLPDDVMMEFTIENNKYQLTSGQLYGALVDGSDYPVTNATKKEDNGVYIPLEPGKNYVFTFTVGKQKISNLTAKVAQWEEVNATELLPTNARIQVALEDRGAVVNSGINLYRCPEVHSDFADDYKEAYAWKTNYTGYTADGNDNGKADPFTCSPAGKWTTDWFWPHNKMYYHFRALSSNADPVTTDVTNGDFVTLAHAETSYTDVTWGAPFKDIADDAKITYDPTTHGFDGSSEHQINYGIGPTENTIKMLMFHMMSDVTINVISDEGSAQVQLGDGSSTYTTIELKDIYTAGKVTLGNGLVSTTGEKSDFTFTNHPALTYNKVSWSNYGAIPQSLAGVKLVITTADHNQYIVDMENVMATSVSSNNITNPYTQSDTKWKIDRWYPGFTYTYTFKLNKKGITDITATILQWEDVVAGKDDVQIK